VSDERAVPPGWVPDEIDVVEIPPSLALQHGVEPIGTVVWYVAPAPFATIECCLVSDNPDRLRTLLLDVPIRDLRPVRGS
jgi:hypothetical protein